MKTNLLKYAAFFACLLCFAVSAQAQKRKKTTTKKPPVVETTTTTNVAEIKTGAEKVSTQIKNVSKFVFVLGDVARIIEDLDREIADGKASRNAANLNAKNKQSVITTIKNLRAGLAALEIEFRTKPGLKTYLPQIQGITDMTGVAEDQAAAGKMTDSGKTLLIVIEKLSDTLAALP